MTANEPSQDLLSDDDKLSAIKAVLRKLAPRLGVDPDLIGAKITWGSNSGLSPEQEHELAKAKGFQLAFQTIDELFPGIRTQDDLDLIVQGFSALVEAAPTIARNQVEKIKSEIPRRGGPGRTPKLNHQESTIVCIEILKLVGKKYTDKAALDQVSKKCPDLLHKKVSARTLRKAWDKRDEFLREFLESN
jgi:hypothetical protein